MSTSQASLSHLFAAHHDAILRFVRSRAPEDAEDLVADVFAVAVRRADAIPAGAERAWLFGVAKNVLREHHREQRRAASLLAELGPRTPTSVPGPEPVVIGAAFEALPTTERAVLALTGLEGLSSAEAAERLGMSAGSTRNAMVRARRNLATQLVGFGLLCGLALVAVLLSRRDRDGAAEAPRLAQALARDLSTAREVSAVAQASGAGGGGRVTFRVDRKARRQTFGLGDGVRASGPLGGKLRATGPVGTPKATVDAIVRRRTPVLTALRTITEGQVAGLIADGAAGRATLRTTGAGAALRTTVEGDVSAFGGQRLALRVALAGTPSTLRRVQARPAGSRDRWTTLDVDRWKIAAGAPAVAQPASGATRTPRPTASPATPSPKPKPRSPATGTLRNLTAQQAADNRAVVATSPTYEGTTGAVRYSELRSSLPGKETSVERRWVEIGGGHRSHQIFMSYDTRGRPMRGTETWWDDHLSVVRSLTARGERLAPTVALLCPGQFNMTATLEGFPYSMLVDGEPRPGRRIRGRRTIFTRQQGGPGAEYVVWFDAATRVPLRYVVRIKDQPRANQRTVTDVVVWKERRAGGPTAQLAPVLPKRYRLQDLRRQGCPSPSPTPGPTTPAPLDPSVPAATTP